MNRKERRRLKKPTETGPRPRANGDSLQAAMDHHQAGRLAEAIPLYERALAEQPTDPEAANYYGVALFQMNDLNGAATALSSSLSMAPNYAEAAFNLGLVERRRDDLAAAKSALAKAVKAAPEHVAAHYNLGNVLMELGEAVAAVKEFRRTLTLDPGHTDARYQYANLLHDEGRNEEAIEEYTRVIAAKPNDAHAHNNMGRSYREMGQRDEAEACFRDAVKADPGYAIAYFNISQLRKFTEQTDDVHRMRELFDTPSTSDADRIHLGFGLTKVFDDLNDADQASAYMIKGNELKRKTLSYDIALWEAWESWITDNFPEKTFAEASDAGDTNNQPILVLGMPRSGTTLVEQILSSHSQVFGAGELGILEGLATASEYPDKPPDLSAKALKKLARGYASGLDVLAPGSPRIVDKGLGNYYFLGLIALALPNARIIHCRRDPMDTCLSCFKLLFRRGQEFTYDQAELGAYYRLYSRVMAHWNQVLPGRILEMTYEDVVADQEGESRRLLEFCGLEWEDACLQFHKTDRRVATASAEQVRRPIYKSSVKRWADYRRHLAPLEGALGELVQDNGGNT